MPFQGTGMGVAQNLCIEPFLVTKMIIDRGNVGSGGLADSAHRRASEAGLRENLSRRFDQSLSRCLLFPFRFPQLISLLFLLAKALFKTIVSNARFVSNGTLFKSSNRPHFAVLKAYQLLRTFALVTYYRGMVS